MINPLKNLFVTTCLVAFWGINLSAQKDTDFWFVAPEVTKGTDGNDYDRPVIFRFSSYDAPAQVTISQPANPAFPPQTFSLGANATQTLTLPPFFEFVENTPPNQVNNLGFYITATAPISAYYEIPGGICMCNPAIFSLKGKNALGDAFYVPFQTFTRNSGAGSHLPRPHAAFDIVATENNTTIDITPTKAIVGHPANVAFSITLQRGQTWSGQAVGQLAADHPTGTKVVANKPVAITMKDDLLEGNVFNGGFCRDLIGDQIVPVKRLGTRYVVQKGLIDGTEKAFVLATANGTTVSVNGTTVATLNAGQQAVVDIIANSYFIETSSPAYVLQLTGFGCEVAAEVLPPVDCSGSTATRFVRFNTEPFYLFLVTRNGNQGSFLLNNTPGIIQASSFNVVPGSGGDFVAARIQMSLVDIPFGVSSLVSNTSGLFQLGILSGQDFATGGRFGYFSDYENTTAAYDTLSFCQGDSINWFDLIIVEPGDYVVYGENTLNCTDTIYYLHAKTKPSYTLTEAYVLCPGDTLAIYELKIVQPGIYSNSIAGVTGCDTVVTIVVSAYSTPKFELPNGNICESDKPYTLVAPDGFEAYKWSTGKQTQSIVIQSSGIYNLQLFDACNVIDTFVEIIFTSMVPDFDIGDTISLCQEGKLVAKTLQPDVSLLNYAWSNGSSQPSIEVELPGLYSLFSSNICGQKGDSVIVTACPLMVYVPNIFSPNDDGDNDVFNAFSNVAETMTIQIFDRWGGLVYEESGSRLSGWDGTWRGKPVVVGVYTYLLQVKPFFESTYQKFSGTITVIR